MTFPPEQIRHGFTNNSACLNFFWATSNTTAADYEPVAMWGYKKGALTNTVAGASTQYVAFDILSSKLHNVTVCGLQPYTQLYWSVGDASPSQYGMSAEYPALSRPLDGARNVYPLSFLVYGDMGVSNSENTAKLLGDRAQGNVPGYLTPNAIIHAGDISYADNRASINGGSIYDGIINDFYNLVQNASAYVPYMMSVGNHEAILGYLAFQTRVSTTMPQGSGSNFWYSWNYGPVHFTAFSVEHDFSVGSPQYNWIVADLTAVDRTVTPWVIAYAHRPMICSNTFWCPDQMPLRDALEPVFNAPATKVDIMMSGHVHAAEVIYPSINGSVISNSFMNMNVTWHVMSGFPGDVEVCCNQWYQPQPAYSYWRVSDFSYFGFTELELQNDTHAIMRMWDATNRTVNLEVLMSRAL